MPRADAGGKRSENRSSYFQYTPQKFLAARGGQFYPHTKRGQSALGDKINEISPYYGVRICLKKLKK